MSNKKIDSVVFGKVYNSSNEFMAVVSSFKDLLDAVNIYVKIGNDVAEVFVTSVDDSSDNYYNRFIETLRNNKGFCYIYPNKIDLLKTNDGNSNLYRVYLNPPETDDVSKIIVINCNASVQNTFKSLFLYAVRCADIDIDNYRKLKHKANFSESFAASHAQVSVIDDKIKVNYNKETNLFTTTYELEDVADENDVSNEDDNMDADNNVEITNVTHTVTKSFSGYLCAHRKPNHNGHCKFLHSYYRSFTFKFVADAPDKCGFVIDFGKLGFIREYLNSTFQDTILVSEFDPEIELLLDNELTSKRVKVLPDCSIEGTNKHLLEFVNSKLNDIEDYLNRGVRLVEVETKENCKNSVVSTEY